MTKLRSRLTMIGVFALAAVFMALPAVATADPQHVTDVNTAVSGAKADVVSVISTNLPVILAVTVAFLMIPIGKRLVRFLKG